MILFEEDHFKVNIIDCGKSFYIKNNPPQTTHFLGKKAGKPLQRVSALEGSSKIDIYRLGILFEGIWPLNIYPFLPDDIQDELPRIIKKMCDEADYPAELPRISLQEIIDSFSSMLSAITDPLEVYRINKAFLQPFDLQEITHKLPSINPDKIALQQSPFSQRLSLFAFISTDGPERPFSTPTTVNRTKSLMPKTYVKGRDGQLIPLLQLPFFDDKRKAKPEEQKLMTSMSQAHSAYSTTPE